MAKLEKQQDVNYYDELLENINNLLKENKIEEALELINLELSMPYVPKDVELNLKVILKNIITSDKNPKNASTKTVPINKFIDLLNSDNNDDNIIAIDMIRKLNIRNFIEDIKQFLVNPEKDDKIKTLLIIFMKEQDINLEITLIKDKPYKLNLQKIDKDYFEHKIEMIDNLISYYFSSQNPTFAKIIYEQTIHEFFRLYPYDFKDVKFLIWANLFYILEKNDFSDICYEHYIEEFTEKEKNEIKSIQNLII